MSKRTLFLIFALFLFISVFLIIAIYQPQTSKINQTAITPKKLIAQTDLSFEKPILATPSSALVSNYSLAVSISTGENKVTAVNLELSYDPQVLTNVTVIPGSFFAKPDVLLNQIDAKTGIIFYTLGVGFRNPAVTGKGTVAIIAFSSKAKTPEKTTISFLPRTLVTASEINESVLKQATNGFFVLGEDFPATNASSNQ